MGYNNSKCYQRLKDMGLNPCGTEQDSIDCYHYLDVEKYHSFCAEASFNTPVQVICCKNCATQEVKVFKSTELIKECSKLHDQDPNWNFYQCYCMCLCNFPSIEVHGGQAKVHKINCGDKVLSGCVKTSANKPEFTWNPTKVEFSKGLASRKYTEMIQLLYGDKKTMIVTLDHVFMLSDGKLILAEKLKPGDQLIDMQGNQVPVISAALKNFAGEVHHISTSMNFDGTIDDHLVAVEGVVCGDYTLQLYFEHIDNSLKA